MADILFVAPDLHRGGVGRCVNFMVEDLPKHGLHTSLFCLRAIEHEFSPHNVRVTRAITRRVGNRVMQLLAPWVWIKLLMTIRRENPSIVCSHGLLCNILVAMAKAVMPGGFRSVAFEHNSPSAHYRSTTQARLKRLMLRLCYGQHDVVVGVSKGVVEDLLAMVPSLRGKCRHIYNGVPIDDVRAQGRASASPLPRDGKHHVISVGRLTPGKGFQTLIDAAALLDDPAISFTIVGEGPQREELERRIAGNRSRSAVELAGHLDNPFPVLAGADIFLSVAERESFGIVLVEALALGVPVVATDCPSGPGEILDGGKFGELVPVGDAPAVARAIRALAADPPRRQHLAELGPQRAADFSLDQHCRNIVGLFQPLLQKKNNLPIRSSHMTRIPVSVVVMTKNEEKNINKCLKALADFSEIFVVDSGSTDKTAEMASALGAHVVQFRWDRKYPKKKQWCLDNLPFSHDVVLYVDADEEMTPELAREIADSLPKFAQGAGGAFIGFDYFFCGKKLHYGHRVYKLALLERSRGRFLDYDDLNVAHMWEVEGHYQPQVTGTTFVMNYRMGHHDHDSLFHYFDKHNRYSDWEASLRVQGLMNDPREANMGMRSLMKRVFQAMPLKTPAVFVHTYFLRLGFLDGKAGLDYAIARAMYYWQIGLKSREIKATETARRDAQVGASMPHSTR